jgi:hypothetical protein
MGPDEDNDRQGLIDSSGKSINVEHIAGVVDQTEIERLRRLIFRSTKGKSYMYISAYDDQADVGNARRSVYIITFQNGPHIKEKIERICDSFSGQRYELPPLAEIPSNIQKVGNSIADARNVYTKTKRSLR